MDPINFPGMDAAIRRHQARLQRAGLTEDSEANAHPAIEGKILAYHKIFLLSGIATAFIPGCFREIRDVPLLIDHEAKNQVADRITVVDSKDGLLFRCDLARTKNPALLARLIETENRRCLSVGCKVLASETRNLAGIDVRIVTEAVLVEASLVRAGACEQAFAFITDASRYSAPTPTSRSADFDLSETCYRIGKAAKRIKRDADEMNGALDKRLGRIEDCLGVSKRDVADAELSNVFAAARGSIDQLLETLRSIKV